MLSAMQFPEHWVLTSLGLLAESMRNGIYKPDSDYSPDGVPTLRMYNITPGGGMSLHNLRRVTMSPEELISYGLIAGDLLINRVNSRELVGKTCLIPDGMGPLSYESKNIRLRVRRGYAAPGWIHQWLQTRQVRAEFEAGSKATTGMATLDQGKLGSLPVPLPPLREQNRIVDKLEALQTSSHRLRETLGAVPGLLDQLRQSILAAAFRGDLTADWRARNPDVEPADKLLEKIRAERRRRWQAAELAKLTAKGKPPADDRWKKEYEEPVLANIEDLPELPPGWCWAPLGYLGADPLATVQTGPFGALLHSSEFVEEGVPVIAVGNLTGMGFRDSGLYFITSEKAEQLAYYDVHAEDVLFARSGATLGKVCVVPSHVSDWRMTGHILRARLNRHLMSPEVLVYALHGMPAVVAQVQGGVRGMTRPGYNTGLLERILVPVPPRNEQIELEEHIKALFRTVDVIENAHGAVVQLRNGLDTAILAKAFRGELVPQDPNDEPASVLLERLRAEAAAAPAKPGRRPRAPAASESPGTPVKASAAQARPAPAPVASKPVAPVPATPMQQPPLPGITPIDFLELPADTQTTQVHALLLGEGALEREHAVRRAAEILRDIGKASFQRLRRDGPLATCIDAAIAVGLRQGSFDRPAPGIVRALAPTPDTVPPALWRRALLAALAEPGTDADAAVRDAAAWSQTQFGLEFQRLRTGGRIDAALQAVLAQMLASREIVSDRHGILSPGPRRG